MENLEQKFISKGHILANIAFIMSDVLEMLILEAGDELKKENRVFKQDVKYRYNNVKDALKLFRRSFLAKTKLEVQESYGKDSDIMYNMIKLIIDRSGDNLEISKDIFNDISKLPSQFNLEIDKDCYNEQ